MDCPFCQRIWDGEYLTRAARLVTDRQTLILVTAWVVGLAWRTAIPTILATAAVAVGWMWRALDAEALVRGRTIVVGQTIHVLPVDDIIDHPTDQDRPCGPTTETSHRDDGTIGWVIVHHALDGRESQETT